jgi:transposase
MIHLTAQSKIWLATEPQDFRKGIDGFAALCRQAYQLNPQEGALFVFINRSKTMIRLLAYEQNGYWLMTKRLSKGKFTHWPKTEQRLNTLMAKTLRQLLNNTKEADFRAEMAKKA